MDILRSLGFVRGKHSVRTEVMAGLTTFLTMAYILAVNPDILSVTGMDKGAVFTATALASALGTLLMAFLARLPFAQAPGMGINAFFAFTLCGALGYSWQVGLAAVFIEGIIFILLTVFNVREAIIKCVPTNLQYAISAGIGMFIAFVGLKSSGIIVASEATLVQLGDFTPTTLLAMAGIVITGALVKRGVNGALFYGIIITTIIGLIVGVVVLPQDFSLVAAPQSLEPTFLQFDFTPFYKDIDLNLIFIIFMLVFIDIFNTLGTLIGAAAKADMINEQGEIKNAKESMLADAIATSAGAVLGTSTVTTYVESTAGITAGGRTGLTALTTAGLFLVATFLSPLFLIVPSAATASALVLVGVFMIDAVPKIKLHDISEALPAFITMLFMVLTYDISKGMAFGMLSYIFIKVLSGNYKDISLTLWIVGAMLIVLYVIQGQM